MVSAYGPFIILAFIVGFFVILITLDEYIRKKTGNYYIRYILELNSGNRGRSIAKARKIFNTVAILFALIVLGFWLFINFL
jgi:hypothetical protein